MTTTALPTPVQTHTHIASFPGPAQLSVTFSTERRERAWYLFSREWRQVRGGTGPIAAKRTKERDNLTHISSYRRPTVVQTKCWVCSWLKIHETQPVSPANFHIFRLHHAHMRKDTRLSLHFRTESDGKLGGAWERGYTYPHKNNHWNTSPEGKLRSNCHPKHPLHKTWFDLYQAHLQNLHAHTHTYSQPMNHMSLHKRKA